MTAQDFGVCEVQLKKAGWKLVLQITRSFSPGIEKDWEWIFERPSQSAWGQDTFVLNNDSIGTHAFQRAIGIL